MITLSSFTLSKTAGLVRAAVLEDEEEVIEDEVEFANDGKDDLNSQGCQEITIRPIV